MAETFRQRIQAAYLAEIEGAAWFAALLVRFGDDDDKHAKLQILQQLERTTAARLIPLIGAQQAQRLDCASAESRGRALAARIESWERLVQMLRSDLPPYIARYQALLREAPASERAAVEFLLAHELALQTFAQEEAAGRGAASLIEVRRLLV